MPAQSDPGGLPPSSGGVLAPARPVLNTSSVDPEDQQRMARGNQLAEMVDQQPNEVAQLMRGWLGDGRGGRS